VLGSSHRSEAREKAKSLLPPSGGSTQAGTTASLAFRAMVETDGESIMEIVL
jgi:hypothetical protein